jgi:AraC-like DNA-binding protein
VRILEEHVAHPGESVRFLRIETDRFRGQRHRHRQLELTWIEHGVGLRYVGDSVAPFGPGDLVLLGADLPHAWVSAGPGEHGHGARGHGRARASVLQFPLALFEQDAFPELKGARPLAEHARRGLLIGGACAGAIVARLGRMSADSAFGRLAGLIEILGWLAAKPADLTRIASSALVAATREGQERRVDRVTEWVARNMHRRLELAEAARIARVTPGAFSRFFRREAGKAFSSYVNDVRCGEACLRLRESRKPIATIAADCGFASISHFNRQFQRRMRVTPRQYRRAR